MQLGVRWASRLKLQITRLTLEGDIQTMITRLAETVFMGATAADHSVERRLAGIRATKGEYIKHFAPKELLSSFTVWATHEVDCFWQQVPRLACGQHALP